MNTARSIRSPQWYCQSGNRSWNTSRLCNLQTVIESKMDGLQEGIGGLTFDDFSGHRSVPHPDPER